MADTKPISAICGNCNEEMVSTRGGHFVSCACGESYIDRDRWFPDRVRLGGQAQLVVEPDTTKE